MTGALGRLGTGLARVGRGVATIAATGVHAAAPALLSRLPAVEPAPGLDPDLHDIVRVYALASPHRAPVVLGRLAYRLENVLAPAPPVPGVRTSDELLPLPGDATGGPRGVRVRRYDPVDVVPDSGLVYVHGGGFCFGSVETHDRTARRLAATGVTVWSVEYRLAPEHPFPAPLIDITQAWVELATRWAAAGGEPARLGIGGDSAGGHAATHVALEATAPVLDVGRPAPAPGFVWALYPGVDTVANSGPAAARLVPVGGMLSGPMVARFSALHVRDAAVVDHPALNPLHREDAVLAAHPPIWVGTVGTDPLRDQGRAYAERLTGLGVDVLVHEEPGMAHDFITWTGVSSAADAALSRCVAGLTAVRRRAAAALDV